MADALLLKRKQRPTNLNISNLFLIDKDLQYRLAKNDKHDLWRFASHEMIQLQYREHVHSWWWSKSSDPCANRKYQEATTPPEHPLSHLNLLDVCSLEPSSPIWAHAPTRIQRSQTVKRERAPIAQTSPLQHLRRGPLHAMSPHDQASFFLTTISSLTRDDSKLREVGHWRSFFETLL